MGSEFEMSVMGKITFLLGLQIRQFPQGTSICQEKYIKDLLKRFNMQEANIIDTPMSTSTKFGSDEISSCSKGITLKGFWIDKKSILRMTLFPGSSLISWEIKKQNSVALSTAEAEYVVVSLCCAQLMWIEQQL
ncbi:uncharacterized protein LOC125863672 [Solanum stenotomum]|uniref:uncharacterized protein LOC125863672 n=1 Tax=Solanum stenotomum TaxID=172797 RepID=UPI0020D1A73F|nr:uncharacterized protein LOC125863672 [Solanum stenotomum]